MWWTPLGERVLRGAEWELFRDGLAMVRDLVVEAKASDDPEIASVGVGAFDAYAIPLRAYVVRILDYPDRLELSADVERVVPEQRSYEIERVRLGTGSETDERDEQPRCRYVIVGPGGNIVRAGSAAPSKSGQFAIDLRRLGNAGLYTIAVAVLVGGNTVNPEVKLVEHRVAGTRTHRTRPRAQAESTIQ